MADEGFFGLDGTQPLPPDPLLPDPLGGLVTGFTFTDLDGEIGVTETTIAPPAAPRPAEVRRRPAAGAKRPVARPTAAAAPPAAIPVAASLPSRPRQQRQPTAMRPTAVPVTGSAGRRPVLPRQDSPGRLAQQQQLQQRRRSGGAGCSVFLFIVVIVVVGFVVLGIVLGQGGSGLGGG